MLDGTIVDLPEISYPAHIRGHRSYLKKVASTVKTALCDMLNLSSVNDKKVTADQITLVPKLGNSDTVDAYVLISPYPVIDLSEFSQSITSELACNDYHSRYWDISGCINESILTFLVDLDRRRILGRKFRWQLYKNEHPIVRAHMQARSENGMKYVGRRYQRQPLSKLSSSSENFQPPLDILDVWYTHKNCSYPTSNLVSEWVSRADDTALIDWILARTDRFVELNGFFANPNDRIVDWMLSHPESIRFPHVLSNSNSRMVAFSCEWLSRNSGAVSFQMQSASSPIVRWYRTFICRNSNSALFLHLWTDRNLRFLLSFDHPIDLLAVSGRFDDIIVLFNRSGCNFC
jgi:hypothetical protein